MLCCVPTTRTQVYLTQAQRQRIDTPAEVEGVTLAEIVRRTLDAYLDEASPDPPPALTTTYAADPRAAAPARDEWAGG